MTEQVTEPKNEQKYELITLEEKSLLQLYTDGTIDSVVTEIRNRVSRFEPDMTTNKGRKEIASMARKVSSSKTYLDGLGKGLKAEWEEKSKRVDAQRRKVRDQLDELKEEIRRPLTEWEQKEKDRIASFEAKIEKIKKWGAGITELDEQATLDQLKAFYKSLDALEINSDWDEFETAAYKARVESLATLEKMIQTEEEKEKLKKAKEEEERKAREAEIRKEIEEKARKEAEEKARAEKEEVERKLREAEEREARAKKEAEAKEAEAKKQAELREKQIREEEERKRQEEINRIHLEERKKREAAIKEQELIEKRAKDKEVQARVNREIVSTLVTKAGLTEDQARKVVVLAVRGECKNLCINYGV